MPDFILPCLAILSACFQLGLQASAFLLLVVGGALFLYFLIQAKSFPPTMTGKSSTVCQFSVLLLVLLFNMLGKEAGFLFWLYIVAGILTVISGYEYVQRGREWFRSAPPKK